MRQGVLDIPAPVISRVFQELSQGVEPACSNATLTSTGTPPASFAPHFSPLGEPGMCDLNCKALSA
eukprot:436815-Amphidinium_carterae.1